MNKEEQLLRIALIGINFLKTEKGYKQIQIVNKLRTLNLPVSTASFSNLVADKKVGIDVIQNVATGVQKIIESECNCYFDGTAFSAQKKQIESIVIEETDANSSIIKNNTNLLGFKLYTEGRIKIEQKTAFMENAQSEVIEVGVRLKTFTEYFYSRNEQEFKQYIVNLLKRGIKLKYYMLDPDSNEASLYFSDRTKGQEDEKESVNEMKRVIHKLEKISKELEANKYSGSFEVFLYKHIPTNHFLVVDGKQPHGKMLVSHYLFGLRRAECPVIEIDKRFQPLLFKKYLKSMSLFITNAKQIIPLAKSLYLLCYFG